MGVEKSFCGGFFALFFYIREKIFGHVGLDTFVGNI